VLIAPRDVENFWTVLPATSFCFLIFQCMYEGNPYIQFDDTFFFLTKRWKAMS
jgi:hypothetical protein